MTNGDMASKCVDSFVKALHIAKKDAKVYFFKAPNFTYGLLMPVSLFLLLLSPMLLLGSLLVPSLCPPSWLLFDRSGDLTS